jgi:hypothetical protein
VRLQTKNAAPNKPALRQKKIDHNCLSTSVVGRADEAAAVASVYVTSYDDVADSDALHNGGETLALVGVVAVEAIATLTMYAPQLLSEVRLLPPQKLMLLMQRL